MIYSIDVRKKGTTKKFSFFRSFSPVYEHPSREIDEVVK